MHSVCCCSLPVWRRSSLKKGTPVTYFGPALDPPLGRSGRKTTTLVRDLEYFIHTKFHQNLSSSSGEEVENVNCLTDDGRQTDGRTTDAGQRVITIGQWSLWLLCPKNVSANQRPGMPSLFTYWPEKNFVDDVLSGFFEIHSAVSDKSKRGNFTTGGQTTD